MRLAVASKSDICTAAARAVASGSPKRASTTGIKGSAAVIAAVRPAR
jgi:hypothetical protein